MNPTLSKTAAVLALAMSLTAVWTARAADPKDEPKKDTYPLATCVVSGGKLGEMGDAVKYDYKGREIRFCCQGCIKTFEKDPAKYLKLLDDAAAKKQAEAAKPVPADTK